MCEEVAELPASVHEIQILIAHDAFFDSAVDQVPKSHAITGIKPKAQSSLQGLEGLLGSERGELVVDDTRAQQFVSEMEQRDKVRRCRPRARE